MADTMAVCLVGLKVSPVVERLDLLTVAKTVERLAVWTDKMMVALMAEAMVEAMAVMMVEM